MSGSAASVAKRCTLAGRKSEQIRMVAKFMVRAKLFICRVPTVVRLRGHSLWATGGTMPECACPSLDAVQCTQLRRETVGRGHGSHRPTLIWYTILPGHVYLSRTMHFKKSVF